MLHREAMNQTWESDRDCGKDSSPLFTAKKQTQLYTGRHNTKEAMGPSRPSHNQPRLDSVEGRCFWLYNVMTPVNSCFCHQAPSLIINLYTPEKIWLIRQSLICAFPETSLVNQTAGRFYLPQI